MSDAPHVMPSAPETEADVLASCLSEGMSWWAHVERLGGEDPSELFWDSNLRLVASAFARAREERASLTISSVTDRLTGLPASDALVPDITSFLVQLSSRATIRTVAELQGSVNTLGEKRALRGLIVETERILESAKAETARPNDVSADLRQVSLEGGLAEETRRFGELIQEIEDTDALGVPWRVPTGIRALDDAIRGGWEPGRLYVLGARPKVGKTTVILSSCLEALTTREGQERAVVVFASLEIGIREFFSKLLSAQAWVPQREVQSWLDKERRIEDFTEEEQESLLEAREELKAARLYPLFSQDLRNGVDSVISATMGVKSKYPEGTPIVVFIDYIQLLATGESFNKSAELGIISRKLKLFADEMGVAVITPSQINRAGAEEGMPGPHNLRESGNLEQDADVVALLNRPALQDPTEPEHVMDVWVALNRVGPSKHLKAYYEPEYQTVRDLPDARTDAPRHGDEDDTPSSSRRTSRSEEGARPSSDDEYGED